jgi:hypothetical protein
MLPGKADRLRAMTVRVECAENCRPAQEDAAQCSVADECRLLGQQPKTFARCEYFAFWPMLLKKDFGGLLKKD